MAILIFFQLLVPTLFFVWLAVMPQPSRLGLLLQYGAAVLVLLGSYLAGLWTLIPRWSLVLPVAIGVAALMSQGRTPRVKAIPNSAREWFVSSLSIMGIAIGGWAVMQALSGHRTPGGTPVELAMPLRGGDLMVANGGARLLINAHQDTLDLSVPRHRLWYGQSYGVDLVALNTLRRTTDQVHPADPARYAVFGRAVHAPCSGTVKGLRNDRPDLLVPKVDPQIMEGNHVRLGCGNVDVVLAHLKRGSVRLALNAQVASGDVIGAVGNSGMSDEPHLHIHAQTPGTAMAPNSGRPIPMLFNGRFLARNGRI